MDKELNFWNIFFVGLGLTLGDFLLGSTAEGSPNNLKYLKTKYKVLVTAKKSNCIGSTQSRIVHNNYV